MMDLATFPPARQRDDTQKSGRVVLYSHDTFGLGHLRRSRALASAITAADPKTTAIILTGSPIAGRFTFPERVDHMRLPGVTKMADGSYISQALGMGIDETTAIRAGLIKSAVEQYDPDLLIVDKEPTGFRGELLPTLDMLRSGNRTKIVLGLRDVLDSPDVLAPEWERKGGIEATEKYYDEIWVYGLESFYDPTSGLALSDNARDRMFYTGYLRREGHVDASTLDAPYILVTPGGGGDGEAMVDLVLSAYEQDPDLSPMAILVYGPFLSGDTRDDFELRVKNLKGRVRAVGFESEIETLFAGAQGVVCMGGYNTFCEVLSFDQRAVIVPRTVPRREQHIRAKRGKALGLIQMLDEDKCELTSEAMIRAIRGLPQQNLPSQCISAGLLDGLDKVIERSQALMAMTPSQAAK